MTSTPIKITFGQMRAQGVRCVLVYCRDHHCSHHSVINAGRWGDLAAIYGRADPSLSREQVARRSMLARYHAMLAKAALRLERLKVNPNRQACGDQNADGSQLAFAGF